MSTLEIYKIYNHLLELLKKEVYRVSLTVKSAVRSQIKKARMRVAGDFWNALNDKIRSDIKRATKKAKANGRKTVRATDLEE